VITLALLTLKSNFSYSFIKYLSKVNEWKSECTSNHVVNSVQEAESLLKKHHELSDDISQIYAEVSNNKN
jgi:hypothetical protein